MKKVLKYKLNPKSIDVQQIKMPKGAEILSIQFQRENLCVWALTDLDKELESRHFFIARTGDPFPDNPSVFHSTFQLFDGSYIGHVFELIKS